MVTYSIKDLEKLSGIKAHTIRIWEQRYHLIEPQRTQTNIRYYTDEDLKYILNIALLNKNGLRISQIAKMSKDEIARKVNSIAKDNFENATQLQALTIAMVELDTLKIEQILNTKIQQNGLEQTVLQLIVPFLEKLSLLWLTGSISTLHEQFIHHIIRRKLLAAIDQLPSKNLENQPLCLVYLMEDEQLEIILVLVKYLLRMRGIQVLYLGAGIALSDLEIAYNLKKPKYIFTSISEHHPKFSVTEYVQQLATLFADTKILLTGYQVLNASLPPLDNVFTFEDFYEITDYFDALQPNKQSLVV